MSFCELCGKLVQYDIIERTETSEVRDEKITMSLQVGICKECGNEIFVDEIEDSNLEKLYSEYRRRKGLLQPCEIKAIREKYGLTQSQFAKLLCVGEKTITRYENGSIQDASINTLIAVAESKVGFQKIFDINGNKLPEAERNRIAALIEEKSTVFFYVPYGLSRKEISQEEVVLKDA